MFRIRLVPRIQNGQSNFEFPFPQMSFQVDTLIARFVRKKPPHQLCLLPSGMSSGQFQGWWPPQCSQTISLVPKEEAGAGSAGRHEVTTSHRLGLHLQSEWTFPGSWGRENTAAGAPWGWDPVCPQDSLGIKEKEHIWSFHAHLLMWESGWKCCFSASNDQAAVYFMPFSSSYYWKYFHKKSQAWPELFFFSPGISK